MTEKSLLIVEDDSDDEALILRALKKLGVKAKIRVAHDGAEAVHILLPETPTPDSRPPDLVLLDLKMPRMDGLDVLARLRADERTRLLPVVVFSSSNREQDIIESYRRGAFGYVCKPMDSAQFADAVSQLGGFWLALNQSPPIGGHSRVTSRFSY